MANDRMKNEDPDRDKQDFGKQTPGRNPQQGQKGADQKNNPGHAEGEDSDEFGGGQQKR